MKKQRLAAYGESEAWSPFEIVARHPLADQKKLLRDLKMRSEECVSCDCWWQIRNQLILVSIWTDTIACVNFYKEDETQNFYVRTNAKPLTTRIVNSILENLKRWMDRNPEDFLNSNSTPNTIINEDIGIPATVYSSSETERRRFDGK